MINIKQEDLKIVLDILAKHLPATPVWAFGSRINATSQTFSDLDLALITNKPMDISTYTELKEAFSNSLLPFKVDLVDFATLDADFKKLIEQNHVELRNPNSYGK